MTTREIELLWGLRGTARRGPKPKLSREAVIRAAVAVADAEGLEGVSMQRVAGELGFTTMSLYRHVDSKEDLLVLMVDAAMAQDPPEPRADGDWRAGIGEWVAGCREVYGRHPWVVFAAVFGPPLGPNGLRWMEAGLRELVRSGLGTADAVQVLMTISSVVRDTCRIEFDMRRAAEAAGSTLAERERAHALSLSRVVAPERFPTIAAMLEEGVMAAPDTGEATTPTEDMAFSLERILDGVELYVERHRTTAVAGGDTP
ncbi:TetR/AcrR family transcriptional regulator C-terminal domain-containing protein [Nocardiopsis sp. NPDC049922]|uniref:TetR/AcrR family transcriptional regulator C-terminal domain-containing protein n=1 Tax=Nocardiopsis sp. NPDC049922 TaxID=3155157 RepID=UPI003409103D